MKKYLMLIAALFFYAELLAAQSSKQVTNNPKPRIIVLTDIAPVDIEPNDMEPLIHMLSHAELLKIEA